MKILLSTLFSLLALSLYAQRPNVQSRAYQDMLETLLSHSVTEISVKAVKDKPYIFLDARELAEYKVSHIQGAMHVGYDKLNLAVLKKIPKNAEIIVYCSVGYRSEKVTEKLQKMGYSNAKNLYGGIFEWRNAGYEVYNLKGKTEQTHAYNKDWGIWLSKGQKVY
jgi:rhodanese-related sulfurtransferase